MSETIPLMLLGLTCREEHMEVPILRHNSCLAGRARACESDHLVTELSLCAVPRRAGDHCEPCSNNQLTATQQSADRQRQQRSADSPLYPC